MKRLWFSHILKVQPNPDYLWSVQIWIAGVVKIHLSFQNFTFSLFSHPIFTTVNWMGQFAFPLPFFLTWTRKWQNKYTNKNLTTNKTQEGRANLYTRYSVSEYQELAAHITFTLRIKTASFSFMSLNKIKQEFLCLNIPSQRFSEYLKEPWWHRAYWHAISWGNVS